tara:strand:+ start:215 stop:1090 length:876 start_codon:yes stop_codon:yes gene_type:complete
MRNTFILELCKAARVNEKIVLIIADLGYNVVEPFQEEFPDRFFNLGISEQAIASAAAGLASQGLKVFVYSIGNFPTFRCAEQIRNDISYHNLDVTIVSVGGGLSYGNLGYSHHAIQDFGLMRLFPEMDILAPIDPSTTSSCLEYAINTDGPKYLRLRKAGEKNFKIENKVDENWQYVSGNLTSKEIILTTGAAIQTGMKEYFDQNYPNHAVYISLLWGQKYKSQTKKLISKFDQIICYEDHICAGGFGSFILECSKPIDREKIKLYNIANSIIGMVGKEDYLIQKTIENFD